MSKLHLRALGIQGECGEQAAAFSGRGGVWQVTDARKIAASSTVLADTLIDALADTKRSEAGTDRDANGIPWRC
jgi:hypothetical protein